MDINNLTLIEVSAEAYYSGQSISCAVVVERDFVEEYEDDFGSVWFIELDGKYSETEGVVDFTHITEDNIKSVLDTIFSSNRDEWQIWESLMDEVDGDAVSKQIEVNKEFSKRIKCETVTKYYLNGMEVKE